MAEEQEHTYKFDVKVRPLSPVTYPTTILMGLSFFFLRRFPAAFV